MTDLIIIKFLTSKVVEAIVQRWKVNNAIDTIPDLEKFNEKLIEREARIACNGIKF